MSHMDIIQNFCKAPKGLTMTKTEVTITYYGNLLFSTHSKILDGDNTKFESP